MSASQMQVRTGTAGDRLPRFAPGRDRAVPGERTGGRLAWWRRLCPSCGAGFHVKTIPPKREGVCDVCGAGLVTRPDDTPETVRNRLAVYQAQTMPLIDFYAARGLLKRMDGSGSPEAVTEDLRRLLA